jgi:hypothetical protein
VTGIDWATQLKKIERQFDGIPTPPTQSELRAQRESERREQQQRRKREEMFGAASRVVLVLSAGLAMTAWPYNRACGAGLYAYLAASAAIVAGGLWATVGTWHKRMPKLHGLALLAVAWGLVLITAQALPRVGYAKIDPRNRPAWECRRPNQASVGVPVVTRVLKRWVRKGGRLVGL